jgi:predicted anti-sigma-YlaC factor YlaD
MGRIELTPLIKPLTCRETTYIVCGARDAPIDAEQSKQLEAHLETCPFCRIAASQFATLFKHLDVLLVRDE